MPPTDPERLYDAHTEVEAGYIQTPDRHSKAYWRKVALAYDNPGHHASQSARFRPDTLRPTDPTVALRTALREEVAQALAAYNNGRRAAWMFPFDIEDARRLALELLPALASQADDPSEQTPVTDDPEYFPSTDYERGYADGKADAARARPQEFE